MFITVEKVKIIMVILMIILALGIFSKLFEKSSSGKEGFQMDSTTVKIADIQNNLIPNSATKSVPLYQPNPTFKPIDIAQNTITMVPNGYYIVDGSVMNGDMGGGGNIAVLPTGTNINPFPAMMSVANIPPGYFKYTSEGTDYLAQIPFGHYIVADSGTITPRVYNMATLPVNNTVGPLPDLTVSNVPDGYYINPVPPGLAKIPAGYYIIDDTYMALFPSGDTIKTAPNTSVPGVTIPNGYYINTITNSDGSASAGLAQLPSGYKYAKLADGVTDDRTNIVPATNAAMMSYIMNGNVVPGSNSIVNGNTSLGEVNTKYDPTNYTNVTYHDTPEDIMKQTDAMGLEFGSMTVVDATGKKISYPYVPGQGTPTYYTPGSFVFGPSNYVPNYEDSVYLSRTTGLSTVSTAVPANSVMGGFCSSTDKTTIEQKCNSIPADQCASTSCCVLLGGTKCVSGDDKGPTMKSNYTDPTILTKDYYYYQGKCYGFCQ